MWLRIKWPCASKTLSLKHSHWSIIKGVLHVEGALLKDRCGSSTVAEKPTKGYASVVLYQLNDIAQSASYHFHCKIRSCYLHFLLHQMICLMTQLPYAKLRKTVCGGSSGWLLLQAPFSQLAVQEKGAQVWMASPTGDV